MDIISSKCQGSFLRHTVYFAVNFILTFIHCWAIDARTVGEFHPSVVDSNWRRHTRSSTVSWARDVYKRQYTHSTAQRDDNEFGTGARWRRVVAGWWDCRAASRCSKWFTTVGHIRRRAVSIIANCIMHKLARVIWFRDERNRTKHDQCRLRQATLNWPFVINLPRDSLPPRFTSSSFFRHAFAAQTYYHNSLCWPCFLLYCSHSVEFA